MEHTTPPVQVVQDLYAAFGRGDMPALLDLLAADVDWHFVGRPEDVPFAGHFHGQTAMVDFFTIVGTQCEVHEFGPYEVIDAGDHVVSLGRERVTVRSTGCTFETDWAHLFTIRNGKIQRLREYYDTAAMAQAFRG